MLSSTQTEIVRFTDSCVVIGGPGGGKTLVLTEHYKYLLDSGVAPEKILCLTFTNKTAQELKKRLGFKPSKDVCGPMTFHSLALNFATREREHFSFPLKTFPLALPKDVYGCMTDVLKGFGLMSRNSLKRFLQSTSIINRTRCWANINPGALRIAQEYNQKLRERGQIDFDNTIVEMLSVLQKPEVQGRYTFDHVLVDECQDTDDFQFDLLTKLTGGTGKLFLVGDPAQNIYSWRGASPELFLAYAHSNKVFYLGENFRSTKTIVDFIRESYPVEDKVVAEIKNHFSTKNSVGQDVDIEEFESTLDEVSCVVDRVKARKDDDIVILSRTNYGLGLISTALTQAGIKFKTTAGSGLWQQPEIKAIVAYMRLLALIGNDAEPGNIDKALKPVLMLPFGPTQYLKRKELWEKIKSNPWQNINRVYLDDRNQADLLESFLRFLESNSYRARYDKFASFFDSLVDKSKIADYYQDGEIYPDNDPIENIAMLKKISGKFSTLESFVGFCYKCVFAGRARKGIRLSTIHQFKGLEAREVFLLDVHSGNMPHKRSNDINEEKRIFFVAVSRAKEVLHIFSVGKSSPFVPYLRATDWD